MIGRAELSEAEADPSKKRKVEDKGKAKVRTPVSRTLESIVVDVLLDILQELMELQAEICEIYHL